MLGRRDFLQAAAAAAAMFGTRGLARAALPNSITQDSLLQFDPLGQVTLLHYTDIHAQLVPLYFREPSINIGVGESAGLPPHLTGRHLLSQYGLKGGTPEAYAFSAVDFAALAAQYGRIGGVDRLATLVKAIRAERPGRTLLLDGGDTWQGSYTALRENGADMVAVQNALKLDAMTAHWEFTLGAERVLALRDRISFPFLCGNVKDTTWQEPVFEAYRIFERGGIRVAVIGQAFPYTPIANPRWMMPEWSFGIEEERLRKHVAEVRAKKADLVVLLTHNGFDVDRKLASRVPGIDVMLTGHTHDAIPAVVKVGKTLLVAPGSHGKFLARLDLEVKDRAVSDYRFRLIPVFSDAITPDAEMAALVRRLRAPHQNTLSRVVGRTEGLLYRRGNFNSTFDDLICEAIKTGRDADIALSPGFRWGGALLPGQEITVEDVYNQTAISYPAVYRQEMTGELLKTILEDVADNLFNPDPYYQQGGDMVRVGGLSYTLTVNRPIGQRITDLRLTRTGEPIEAGKRYTVAGWASVNQGTQGPPVWDLVTRYVQDKGTVRMPEPQNVKVVGADARGIA